MNTTHRRSPHVLEINSVLGREERSFTISAAKVMHQFRSHSETRSLAQADGSEPGTQAVKDDHMRQQTSESPINA
jgi:hypothetical protein